MIQQVSDLCVSNEKTFSVESLPFSEIPGQSKIFIEYQQNPLSLQKFYPEVVASHTDISKRIPKVLDSYKTDRTILCDALEQMNRRIGAGEKTFENINLLRETDCVTVVSGQQAGLFSGPLYTIYKALSAVKLTECLRGRGFKVVPVFWIATEDHDFEEVSKAFVINKEGSLEQLKNEPKRCYENLPVGYVKLDDSIKLTIDKLFDELQETEFTADLKKLIDETWQTGEYFGNAFAEFLARIFEKYGLIMLCPLDKTLKKLAAPVYTEAVKKSDEIVSALIERSKDLVENGYHAQVLITEDYFPLFWQANDHTRNALKKSENGTFKTKDSLQEFTHEELAEIAEREPHRFSPSVVLRSVVQDYLLPTVCYFGGAAEIAYFAQSAEVYRILNRPVTPIFHRQSFTVIQRKNSRTLEKYGLNLTDLFQDKETVLSGIVEEYLNPETAQIFSDVEEKINTQLNRLDQNLVNLDSTLADNLANRRRKIIYHIGNLRTKFHHAQIKKDEVIKRRIENLFESIVPHRHLQERTLNVNTFLNRHGLYFVDWIYDAIDLSDKAHRIIYL